MRGLLLILVIFIQAKQINSQENWTLKKEKNGIKVFTERQQSTNLMS